MTMREVNAKALFVRDGERVGIITGTDLSNAAILKRLPIETSVAGERAIRRRLGRAERLRLDGAAAA